MGRHHALLGAVVWLAPAAALGPHSLSALVASTATCGAAAMLPDLDEPGSTVAHVLEPVSGAVSVVMKRWCGGHRQASHSLLAVGGVGVMAFVCSLSRDAVAVAIGLLMLLAFRGLAPSGFRRGTIALVASVGAGVAVALGRLGVAWFAIAVPVGYVAHLIGDMLTTGGVPLLWPSRQRYQLPLLDHTGSTRETVFAGVLWAVALLVLVGAGVWHEGVSHLDNFARHAHHLVSEGP